MPPIREDYQHYEPPAWVAAIVKRQLESLSHTHLSGLAAIVLTESAQVRKGRSRRIAGRKFEIRECRGFYRPKWKGEPAALFLIVDNIVGRHPRYSWWLPFTRDMFLGEVLFHEVGHHLNATVGTMARGEEASAEEWERRLSRVHFRKKYWYLRRLIKPLRFSARLALRMVQRARNAERARTCV